MAGRRLPGCAPPGSAAASAGQSPLTASFSRPMRETSRPRAKLGMRLICGAEGGLLSPSSVSESRLVSRLSPCR